ncbi:MAG: TIGR03790 family protein, partial [Bryobacteraceae bacterium]
MTGSAAWFVAALPLAAETAHQVLVVVNDAAPVSRRIGEYYVRKRGVPLANVCHIRAPVDEEISRDVYQRSVEAPISRCLQPGVLYIATTLGVPLKIRDQESSSASVDSELAVLYVRRRGIRIPVAGARPNPMFGKVDVPFDQARFPIYLVTRLAGYSFDDVRGLIDRALVAVNRGKVVIDVSDGNAGGGDAWLRAAAARVPKDRLVLDDSAAVLYDQREVIAYAAWG